MSRMGATHELTWADVRALWRRVFTSHNREYGAKAVGNVRNAEKLTWLNRSNVPAGSWRDGLPEFDERSGEARTKLWVQPLRSSIASPHPSGMNPGVALLANRSLAFSLYEFNL